MVRITARGCDSQSAAATLVGVAEIVESKFQDDDSEFGALMRRFAAAPEIPLEYELPLQVDTVVADTYRVEAIVGRGGMGVVARATDLRLDRQVALKVHARAPQETGLDVLRVEAQATALVAHPNVVEVFEVGVHDGQLFIAMEFVSGGTLGDWQKGRSQEEIVGKYIEAGRGLAAAHRVGLVHRDFKPANVLMDAEGRPRVADFGLVLDLSLPQAETLRDYGDGIATNPGSVRSGVSVHAIAGTPGYMAPEQAAGAGADATADQYAFCASLASALTGVPARHRDPKAPLPRRTGGKALRAVIERGLAHDPRDRHASLDALLIALEATLRPEPKNWVVGGAVVGVVGIVGVVLATSSSVDRACLAQAQATAETWRDDLASASDPLLSDYARGWLDQRRALCRLRLDAPHRDAAMHCLGVGRDALAAVLDTARKPEVLGAPPPLPPLQRCSVDSIASEAAVEPAAEQATAVAEVESDIARARVFVWSGERGRAVEQARTALQRAETIGHDRTIIRAHLAVGDAALEGGDLDASAEHYEQAFHAAQGEGDDESALDASSALIQIYSDRGELDTADGWAGHAEAAFTRLGGHPALELSLLSSLGNLRAEQGRYDEAVRVQERALSLLPDVGDEVRRAKAHNSLGATLYSRGDPRLAVAQFELALALYRAARGPDHPDNTYPMSNLAWVLIELGEGERAAPLVDDALAILQAQDDVDAYAMSILLSHRGSLSCERGDHAVAQQTYAEGLAIVNAHLGDAHPSAALLLQNIAGEQYHLEDLPGALRSYQEAARMLELTMGPDDEDLALVLSNLAGLLVIMERSDEALAPSTRAIEIFDGRGNRDRPELIDALVVRAEALLATGRGPSAQGVVQRAVGIADRIETSEETRSELAELRERVEAAESSPK